MAPVSMGVASVSPARFDSTGQESRSAVFIDFDDGGARIR
jgi:hypothetical protein